MINHKINDKQIIFMRWLINNHNIINADEVKVRTKVLDLEWLKPNFLVCEVLVDYSYVAYEEKDKLIEDIKDYVHTHIKNYDHLIFVNDENNIIVVLSQFEQNDMFFIKLKEGLYQQFEHNIYLGIGSCVGNMADLYLSALDAHEALGYRYQYEESGIININNIVKFTNRSRSGATLASNKVIECFNRGDLAQLAIQLNDLVEGVRNTPDVSKTSIRRAMIELTVQVLNIASNSYVDVDEVLEGEDPYSWILKQGHTEVIEAWFLQICTKLLKKMNEKQDESKNQTIILAKQYINDNLSKPGLNLSDVSDYVGLTSSYFSTLFKKETSIGVNNYIGELRIETAKKLLESDMKIENIALQLGYSTTSYFTNVFKKNTGITPNKYRKKITKS